jgi:hypothetical protein
MKLQTDALRRAEGKWNRSSGTASRRTAFALLIQEPGETVPRRAKFTVFFPAFRKKWDTTGGFMYQRRRESRMGGQARTSIPASMRACLLVVGIAWQLASTPFGNPACLLTR